MKEIDPNKNKPNHLQPPETKSLDNSKPPTPNPPNKNVEGLEKWLYENNPLYLLSVLSMFAGLWLINKASYQGTTLQTVIIFFGIQNIYEIIMLCMGLYLLKNHGIKRHGIILLIFCLIFLGDVTFYQARISAMCSTTNKVGLGYLISCIYWLLAIIKILFTVYFLELSFRWDKLFYAITAFGLVYFAPLYFLEAVYNLKDVTALRNESLPPWIIYQVCLAVGLIQLPVIIVEWNKNSLQSLVTNKYLGNEITFYRWLIFFPFIILPCQVFANIFADVKAAKAFFIPSMIPILICSAYFIQSLERRRIEREFGLNSYDFIVPGIILAITILYDAGCKKSVNEFLPTMLRTNLILIYLGLGASALTRRNIGCFGLLLAANLYYSGNFIKTKTKKLSEYFAEVSNVILASILVGISFIFLAIGFLLSLLGKGKQTNSSSEEKK